VASVPAGRPGPDFSESAAVAGDVGHGKARCPTPVPLNVTQAQATIVANRLIDGSLVALPQMARLLQSTRMCRA
jgi:hypothetical protein